MLGGLHNSKIEKFELKMSVVDAELQVVKCYYWHIPLSKFIDISLEERFDAAYGRAREEFNAAYSDNPELTDSVIVDIMSSVHSKVNMLLEGIKISIQVKVYHIDDPQFPSHIAFVIDDLSTHPAISKEEMITGEIPFSRKNFREAVMQAFVKYKERGMEFDMNTPYMFEGPMIKPSLEDRVFALKRTYDDMHM